MKVFVKGMQMNKKLFSRLSAAILCALILYAAAALFAQTPEPAHPKAAYTSLPPQEPETGAIARIIFFSDITCEECQEMKAKILPDLIKKYPGQIACRIYDIGNTANFAMLDRFEKKYGRAQNEVPIIFIDGKTRSGFLQEVKPNLEKDIQEAIAKGGSPWAEPAPLEPEVSDTDIVKERLKSLTLMAVIGAGFIDGFNPCAFTTIIFLISYLTLLGKNRKAVLRTGILYTIAVFLTYLALGFGLLTIVSRLVNIRMASKIIYGITGLVTLGVAFFALKDFFKAKRGEFRDMSLKLSEDMQKRIRQSIHDKLKNMGMITGALALGMLVAMFELPCTGQVYLPIVTALSNPQIRARAIPYLILYNIIFIAPLVVVFLVAYFGISSQTIGERFKRHVAKIKFAMGIFFIALSAVLFYMALH